jgi:hypothetical protein
MTTIVLPYDRWVEVDARTEWEALRKYGQEHFEVGRIVRQFGTWAVTPLGIECLAYYYPISKDRLHERTGRHGWEQQMKPKRWCVYSDFVQALDWGRQWHAAQRGRLL